MSAPRREVIGDAELWLGRCEDVLPTLGPADCVLTDPPYGVGIAEWDADINREWVGLIPAADDCHCFVFWSVSRLLDFVPIPGFRYERVLVWHKPMTLSSQRGGATWHWEPIFWYRRGSAKFTECVSDVLTANPPCFRSHPENEPHPTQKPLSPVLTLARLSGAGSILDPFMGSGTTGVACAKLGRRFVGIERDPAHFATACRRIEAAHRQADLFVERPAPKPEQAALALGDAA